MDMAGCDVSLCTCTCVCTSVTRQLCRGRLRSRYLAVVLWMYTCVGCTSTIKCAVLLECTCCCSGRLLSGRCSQLLWLCCRRMYMYRSRRCRVHVRVGHLSDSIRGVVCWCTCTCVRVHECTLHEYNTKDCHAVCVQVQGQCVRDDVWCCVSASDCSVVCWRCM